MLRNLRLEIYIGVATVSALILLPSSSHAQQSYKLNQELQFDDSTGSIPLTGNLLYLTQQLFGATYAGGSLVDANGNAAGLSDLGEIFQFIPAAPFIGTLHGFSGPDGAHPNGSLVADSQGSLYGTTQIGGANNLGTVFKLSPPASTGQAWTLTTLHSFSGSDGANPAAGVTIGPNGNLYGTTMNGGPSPSRIGGSAYTLSTSGTMFNVLPLPQGCVGSQSNVVVDPTGNVIGTTQFGPEPTDFSGCMFKIAPNGTATILTQYGEAPQFGGVAIGEPVGNIVRDAIGNIYGMAELAQRNTPSSAPGIAVYKRDTTTKDLIVLAVLDGLQSQSGVVRDGNGTLYGTTINGGTGGIGSVFSVSASGVVTTLASLSAANLAPVGGVVLDPTGNLWGTSSLGGDVVCTTASSVVPVGCGTIFSLSR
ncbi:MAG: choice-of-anchor tandem repeat GloVer-containing protein, partial [Aliidongia sp.]